MIDRPQDKLRRMSAHFDDEGLYTKANYCLEIIDYIDTLEAYVKELELTFERSQSMRSLNDD